MTLKFARRAGLRERFGLPGYLHSGVGRIIASAAILGLLAGGPILAQTSPSQSPAPGDVVQHRPAGAAVIPGAPASPVVTTTKTPASSSGGGGSVEVTGSGMTGVATYIAPRSSPGIINIGQAFSDAAAPYIDAVVNALIASLIGWVCLKIKQRTGVEIDAGHRDAIVKSLQNQAGSLIADAKVKIDDNGKIQVDNVALAHAVNDVIASVPDALAHFGATPDKAAAYVEKRIVDTIPQIAAGAQMIADKAKAV